MRVNGSPTWNATILRSADPPAGLSSPTAGGRRFCRRLRRLYLTAAFVAVGAAVQAGEPLAGTRPAVALGISTGEAIGLNFAWTHNSGWGAQATLAWDLTTPGGYTATVDGLRRWDGLRPAGLPASAWLGGGLRGTYLMGAGRFDGDPSRIGLFIRLPLGVGWVEADGSHAVRTEAWLEAAPAVRVLPGWSFGVELAIGWRRRL